MNKGESKIGHLSIPLVVLVILVAILAWSVFAAGFKVGGDAVVGGSAPASVASAQIPEDTVFEPKNVTLENMTEYGLVDLLGTASTSFKGSSADRIKNIEVGLSKLHGRVIAPGEEFSTVESIGYVNADEGYTQEFIIRNGQSIKEFGGGLCQIATTLFRATLDAGLPVTERVNHSYVVGYYGPGLDATIYGPHPDLRFVNDTGDYVVLKGRIDGDRLVFEFYGKSDGRKATISEPEISNKIEPLPTKYIYTEELPPAEEFCTENRRQGLTAKVDYTVVHSDGEIKKQTFKSTYAPWQAVCYVGVVR